MSNGSTVTRVMFETILAQAARAQGASTEQAIGLVDEIIGRVAADIPTLERTMALIGEIEERARELADASEDPPPQLLP